MDLSIIVFGGIVLFLLIHGAIRLAISPLIDKDEGTNIKSDLSFMRDIGILSSKEYKNIITEYQRNNEIKNRQIQFNKYDKILHQLQESGILTETEYELRTTKLKEHFKINEI